MKRLSKDRDRRRPTLQIFPATFSNTGNYTCQGKYREHDKIIEFVDTAYVYVGRRLLFAFLLQLLCMICFVHFRFLLYYNT